MTRFAASLAAALALATTVPAAAQDRGTVEAETAAPQTRGERQLEKLLEGRVAGTPVSCIRTMPRDQMRTIDGTAYVYGAGATIYVQRTRDPRSINDNDTLIVNRFSPTQLCRLDTMSTVDRFTGIFSGVVFFEDFVPYTRVKTAASTEG